MSRDVVVGVDQGTSGTRTIAFGPDLAPLAESYRRVAVSHPRPGWVEKDADEVVRSVAETLAEVVAAVGASRVAAVGIDNEGETVVAWDARTLEALHPAVVWSCRRSQAIVDRIAAAGGAAVARALAGTPLDPYFSSTKIRWLLEQAPAVARAAADGRLRVGTLDAYLCARLGDGARSEPSTAARTQLQALAAPGRWDPQLCGLFGIDGDWLPPLADSLADHGHVRSGPHELPLRALLVDQTAALAGHGCVVRATAKATYGTGIFLLAHAGTDVPHDGGGLLPTVAWTSADALAYALDGGVFSAGSAVDWLRDGLGLIASPAETEELARSVADTKGVRFLPALTGLGAPWWRSDARGVFAGLTAGAGRAELVRAVLESLCLRVRDVVEALRAAGIEPPVLRVDGGLTRNRWLLQRQADVLGIPVQVSAAAEATALGAAAAAGVGAGLWRLDELARLGREGELVEPSAESDAWREDEYADWRAFVERVSGSA